MSSYIMTTTTRNDAGEEEKGKTMMSHRCYITCSLVVMISDGDVFTSMTVVISVMMEPVIMV